MDITTKKMDLDSFRELNGKLITCVDTELGYMQLFEYLLPDCCYLHILKWHCYSFQLPEIIGDTLLPRIHTISFYENKDEALRKAHEIGNNLLQQYLI